MRSSLSIRLRFEKEMHFEVVIKLIKRKRLWVGLGLNLRNFAGLLESIIDLVLGKAWC